MATSYKPKKKTRKIGSKRKLTAEDLLHIQKVKQSGSRRNKLEPSSDEPGLNIDNVPDIEVPKNIKLEDKYDMLEKLVIRRTRGKKETKDKNVDGRNSLTFKI